MYKEGQKTKVPWNSFALGPMGSEMTSNFSSSQTSLLASPLSLLMFLTMQKVGVAFSVSKTFKHFWFILLERLVYLRLKLMTGDPLKCRFTIITFSTPSWGQLYSFSWMFKKKHCNTPQILKLHNYFIKVTIHRKFPLALQKDTASLCWFISSICTKTSRSWSLLKATLFYCY